MVVLVCFILVEKTEYVEAADNSVVRNTKFTTMEEMQSKINGINGINWSPVYLTEVENEYWTFCNQSMLGGTNITIDLAKNAYQDLEMLLDNGYIMDYQTLSDYCAEYLAKVDGKPDAFYETLENCLDNPYLENKPSASVTATTYNGRDYAAVFDAQYYYDTNADLQKAIGYEPAELLRHFVEIGINEGRQGNASFNVTEYAKIMDADVLTKMELSSAYTSLPAGKAEPVGKYSYAWANYYGKYLGHYESTMATEENENVSSSEAEENTTEIYTETSTKSVYTNEKISFTLANQRPIAVMIPTDTAAQPSYGIGKADILYEMMEEGGISRQMAIIQDWQNLARIGNIRSSRLYYLETAKEWDSILIHFGGVAYMKGTIDADDMNNISGTYEYGTGGKAPGAGYFFRTTDRVAPHNAYISAAGILKACTQLGYQTNLRTVYYTKKHFTFSNDQNTISTYENVEDANTIDLSNVFTYTKSKLIYDEDTGLYLKYLHGKKQVDATTGEQLSFANVIVQNTKWEQLDSKGYLGFYMLDTTEDGYYFTKGKCIPITWKKTSDYGPTVYYDATGAEIQLQTGKTYIAVAQEGKKVLYY